LWGAVSGGKGFAALGTRKICHENENTRRKRVRCHT